MKTSLQISIVAGLVASALTAWLSPQMIAWYFTPPVEMSVSCKEAVSWGIDVYQKLTLGAALITGVATFFILMINRLKNPPQSPTTPNSVVNK